MSTVRCSGCHKAVQVDKRGVGSLHFCGVPERAGLHPLQPHDKLGVIFLWVFAVTLIVSFALGIYLSRGQGWVWNQ